MCTIDCEHDIDNTIPDIYNNFNSKIQLITPYDSPLVINGDRIGSIICIASDSSYIIADSDPFIPESQTNKRNTIVHLLENLDIQDDYRINTYHSSIKDVEPHRGHIVKCYEEYILISTGYGVVQVFVKTQNPPWSLLKTITTTVDSTATPSKSPQQGLYYDYDEYTDDPIVNGGFGKSMTYVSQTRQVLISDSAKQIIYVYSVFSMSLIAQQLSFSGDNTQVIYQGTICSCYPYLFVTSALGKVNVFKYDTQLRRWTADQIIVSDIPIGYSLTCAANFLFASYVPSVDGTDAYSYSNDQPVVIVYRRGTVSWSNFQIINDPSVNTDGGFISQSFGISLVANEYTITSIDKGIRLAVSDPFKPVTASSTGIVYLYEFDGGQFSLCRIFNDKALSFKTNFGYSVDLSHKHILIGAPDSSSTDKGNVYVYNLSRQKCVGCDMVMNSCSVTDICGVCNGDGTSCAGCDGVPYSKLEFDSCGVCNGDDSTCVSVFPREQITLETGCNSTVVTTLYMVLPMFDSMKGNQIGKNKIDIKMNVTQTPLCGNVQLTAVQEIPYKDFNYKTKCVQNCLYFVVNITYSMYPNCVSNFSQLDPFNVSLQAYKTLKPILFPRDLTIEIRYSGCKGCDDVLRPSGVDSKQFDQCLICGGDGQSCLDCLGVPFGDSFIDSCGTCTTEDNVNKTCIFARTKPEFSSLNVQCSGFISVSDIAEVGPYNPSRSLRWKIITRYSPCGDASIKHTGSANLTFTSKSHDDCTQQLLIEVSDTWRNSATISMEIRVYGCDIVGCDGIRGSGTVVDLCSICGGKNECLDCLGIPHGTAKLDLCGVCNGNNTNCDANVMYIQNMLLQYEELNAQYLQQGEQQPTPLWQTILFISVFPVVLISLVSVVGIILIFSKLKRPRQQRFDFSVPKTHYVYQT
jgi:hypothetical protein